MSSNNDWIYGLTEQVLEKIDNKYTEKFTALEKAIAETTQQNVKLEIKRVIAHNREHYSTLEGQHYQVKPLLETL